MIESGRQSFLMFYFISHLVYTSNDQSCCDRRTVTGEQRTETGEQRTENGEQRTENQQHRAKRENR